MLTAPSADSKAQADDVLDIFLAYQMAKDAGQPIDPSELLAAHPHLADELRNLFEDELAIRRQVEPIREALAASGPAEPLPERLPVIEGYRSIRYLSQGGMGVVYRAWNIRKQCDEAIKVIRKGTLASEEERQRFLREAQNARLEHPNIIRIYHVGLVDGEPYFSMEYAAGGPLNSQVESMQRQWSRIASLLRTVALAVDFANRRSVIHRDLKPANILLAADDTPRVADFGLAQLIPYSPHPSAADVDSQTGEGETSEYQHPCEQATQSKTGAIAGTPSYMAPEQARGEKPTVAVDVYGLGAVLYELLTERPPFRGATRQETLRQVIDDPVQPPSKHIRKVPRDLEAICLKCLQKEPQKRYDSAADLADDLNRYLEGRPVKARPVSRAIHLWMWTCRQPLIAALTGAVLLLAVTLLGLAGRELWRFAEEYRRERFRLYVSQVKQAKGHIDAGNLVRARRALDECPPELRDWDWHYLDRLCRQSKFMIGHEDAVATVRYSPDGRYLLTGGLDGTVILWDARTGDIIRKIPGHRGRVVARFTARGKLIVSAGAEEEVLVRETETGKVRHHFTGVGSTFACDEEGEYLVVVNGRQILRLFDLNTGEPLRELKLEEMVFSLAIHPDGERLALGGFSRKVELRELPTLKILPLEPLPIADTVWAVTFSPDGRYLAAGTSRPVLWDLTSRGNKVLASLWGTGMLACNSLDFSPDAKQLVGTYKDGFIRVWMVETQVMASGPVRHSDMANDAVFSPNGTALAITRGKIVSIEPLAPQVQTNIALPGHGEHKVESVTFASDGRSVASLAGDEILIRDLKGTVLFRHVLPEKYQAKHASPRRLCHDGDALLLACAIGANQLVLLDVASSKEVANTWIVNKVQSLAFHRSPRGLAVLWGDRAGRVHRWLPDTGKVEELANWHRVPISAVALSRDGKLLATGGTDLLIRIWNPKGKELGTLSGHVGSLSGLAFSHDGTRLISCGNDGMMKVWDVRSRAELFDLSGHERRFVTAADFDPTGERLASSGHDGMVRIWEGGPGNGR